MENTLISFLPEIDSKNNQYSDSGDLLFSCLNVSNKTIENCTFTGTFEDASVEDILSMAAESLNLVVTKDGQTFVLQGKGCP